MGFFKSIKKAIKKTIKPLAQRAVGAFGGPVGAAIFGAATVQPRLPRAPGGAPTFPAIPALPPGVAAPTQLTTRQAARGAVRAAEFVQAGMACPPGFHPAKDGSGRCVRNRRMNPMNPRAARRAIRRIKAARKMLMQIERQLPKQRARPRQIVHRRRLIHEDT